MLKRLELQGFKSFAEKTSLEFPAGITAVVGPNGSGKSNIVDAIRWVLGEQSLKNIRLGKSEDVIFAGTPNRAAVGFASVELLFDNSRQLFPEEVAEISVGRKLYRDGESAYILNQQDARLKDVVRLMAAGKLGTKGLAIITQGEGDAFLIASTAERREMLEEVLGLKGYRLKKEESERKMEETRLNLEKVAALLEELAPHVRSLKRQVSRWEKRKEKAEELRALEEQCFVWKIHQIEEGAGIFADYGAIEREVRELTEEIRELEIRRKRAEEELNHTAVAGQDERGQIEKAERARNEALRLFGNIEGKIEALGSALPGKSPSLQALVGLVEKIKSEISAVLDADNWENAKQVLRALVREIELAWEERSKTGESDQRDALEKEKQALGAKLRLLEEDLEAITKSAEGERALYDQAMEAAREVFRSLDEKRKTLAEKQEILQEYRFEEEKRKLQEQDIAVKIREAGWDYEEFRLAHRGAAVPEMPAPQETEMRITRLRRELADIGAVDEELVREYQEAQSRNDFLIGQKQDLKTALDDLSSLSTELGKKIDRDFSRLLKDIDAQFKHYFHLLFGGGNARIREFTPRMKLLKRPEEGKVVTHEDELAVQEFAEPETAAQGVMIDVSIPRKKIKSLDMLSGGERALTAIALVFAVAGASSPPFLILDEIDASLDEANSERFGRLLKELSGSTQFILVTHNRVTMESADVLYGVTMQDGVSKIFSLKFEEAKHLATSQ